MEYRNLDYPADTPVAELGAAAIDALLDRGDLADWSPLLREIAADPEGNAAEVVLNLCAAHPMYGTSVLWPHWILRLRGRRPSDSTTLAQARKRAGLTQVRVAERMGIRQSDVSKLERRSDVLLSTLQAYARAIGARLSVEIQTPEDDRPLRLEVGPG
jgi:DNA-binding XRE family transcriptional regulator